MNNNAHTDYIQLICDASAVLFVCVVYALSDTINYFVVGTQIVFFTAVLINAYQKAYRVKMSIILWGVIFYGFCLLSVFWAYYPEGLSDRMVPTLKVVLVVVTIPIYVNGKRELDILLKAFIIGAAILLFRLILATPLDEWGTSRLGRSIGYNANTVGLSFAYASTICMYYVKDKKLYFFIFLLFALLSLFSGSRKSFLWIILTISMFFFNRMKRPANVLYIVPFGLLIFLIIYLAMNNPTLYEIIGIRVESLLNLITGEGRGDSSIRIRMRMISAGVDLFKENMLIGYGVDGYRHLSVYGKYAHNNYIELLVNHGLIGMALYYFLPVTILLKAINIWLHKTREVVIAIVFIMLILINDYGHVSYYNITTLLLIAISYCFVSHTDSLISTETAA